MKKTNYLFIALLALGSFLSSCEKQNVSPTNLGNISTPSDAVWVTPNGNVIPISEKDNWLEFEKNHFTNSREKSMYSEDSFWPWTRKRIMSERCTMPDGSIGLTCKLKKTSDFENCSKEFSVCTPCGNCNVQNTSVGPWY